MNISAFCKLKNCTPLRPFRASLTLYQSTRCKAQEILKLALLAMNGNFKFNCLCIYINNEY